MDLVDPIVVWAIIATDKLTAAVVEEVMNTFLVEALADMVGIHLEHRRHMEVASVVATVVATDSYKGYVVVVVVPSIVITEAAFGIVGVCLRIMVELLDLRSATSDSSLLSLS